MRTLAKADFEFALCLTHDVDKPFKTPFHALFHGLVERDPKHLEALRKQHNPYWQFESIMSLEDDLGVRSAFYFLNQPSPRSYSLQTLADFSALVQEFGRYDVQDPRITEVIRTLDDGGWEVGLHGSYQTKTDRDRLQEEKTRIEKVLGDEISGGRQHYLRFEAPETWQHYRDIGLKYDASFGSNGNYGFQYGYDVFRPFNDDFVVFPLTLMEQQLPDPGTHFDEAWAVCESLLETARSETAVMTCLFHPRLFSERDFPGYQQLYRRLIEYALDQNAWVGSPREYYQAYLSDQDVADNGPEKTVKS